MASRSLNKVMLIGNLTRDPELRYTPSGTAVCTFGLATNRSWTPSDGGERQEEAEFHRIVAWQKLAELCAQLLFKGRKVFVEGRIQTRSWTSQDGQERTTTEIVIDNMIVLDSKHREAEGQALTAGKPAPAPAPASPAAVDDQSSKQATDDGGKTDDKIEDKKVRKEESAAKKEKEKKEEESGTAIKTDKEEVKADDIPF